MDRPTGSFRHVPKYSPRAQRHSSDFQHVSNIKGNKLFQKPRVATRFRRQAARERPAYPHRLNPLRGNSSPNSRRLRDIFREWENNCRTVYLSAGTIIGRARMKPEQRCSYAGKVFRHTRRVEARNSRAQKARRHRQDLGRSPETNANCWRTPSDSTVTSLSGPSSSYQRSRPA